MNRSFSFCISVCVIRGITRCWTNMHTVRSLDPIWHLVISTWHSQGTKGCGVSCTLCLGSVMYFMPCEYHVPYAMGVSCTLWCGRLLYFIAWKCHVLSAMGVWWEYHAFYSIGVSCHVCPALGGWSTLCHQVSSTLSWECEVLYALLAWSTLCHWSVIYYVCHGSVMYFMS